MYRHIRYIVRLARAARGLESQAVRKPFGQGAREAVGWSAVLAMCDLSRRCVGGSDRERDDDTVREAGGAKSRRQKAHCNSMYHADTIYLSLSLYIYIYIYIHTYIHTYIYIYTCVYIP